MATRYEFPGVTENYFGVFSAEQFGRRFCRNCSVKNLSFLTEQNMLIFPGTLFKIKSFFCQMIHLNLNFSQV